MGALFMALGCAVAYGTSDFVGGLASRRVEVLRVLVVSYPVSAVLLTLAALGAGGTPSGADLAWGAAAGLCMASAAWAFYFALATGPISIISPITALVSSAVPLGIGVALGDRMTGTAVMGVMLALVSVVLVSLAPHEDTKATHPFTGLIAALTVGSGLAWALSYVFTARIEEGSGLWPIAVARWTASAAVLAIAASRSSLAPPTGRPLRQAGVIGVLDAVAHLTMLLALQRGMLSLSSVVISLFPAVTVVLAVAVLGERLTRVQIAALALGAVAVALIGM